MGINGRLAGLQDGLSQRRQLQRIILRAELKPCINLDDFVFDKYCFQARQVTGQRERAALGVAESSLRSRDSGEDYSNAAATATATAIASHTSNNATTTQPPLTRLPPATHSATLKRRLPAPTLPAARPTTTHTIAATKKRLDPVLALGQRRRLQQEDQTRQRSFVRQGKNVGTWT